MTERNSFVFTSYMPRPAGSTRSRGTSVRDRLYERERSSSGSDLRYASRPLRAVLWNTPSRLPWTWAGLTPGFNRPITCSHQ